MSKLPIERLDKSRPYGTIHGEPTIARMAYSQRALGIEAWPYDHAGNLIEEALTPEQKEKLEEKRAKAAAAAAAAASADEQTAAADDEEDYEQDAPQPPKEEANEGVNFEMWLRGEARYKPHELHREAKIRYGVNKPNMVALATYLVEEKKLVPRSQVSPKVLPPAVPNPA